MKWNIQKRLLVLVLAAGILSFLTLSGLSFYGLLTVRNEMEEMGDDLSKAGANFTENLVTYQLKRTLEDLARARAEFIDNETELIRSDVKVLADTMTQIASNPNDYKPVKVLNPRFEPVYNKQTYLTYGPDVKRDGLTPELEHEIGIASNIRTLLAPLAGAFINYKSSCYVGSKHGWLICSSVFPDNDGPLPFEESEFFDYDPRERPWYKAAIAANAPVFSDLYAHMNIGKYQLIGCSAPYYDASGNAAGVVGIDVSNTDIYEAINETAIGSDGSSFVLNKDGKIIFSSRTEGELVAMVDGEDLRSTTKRRFARAVWKMMHGESGIMPVTIDGEDYFLAFAPMESTGWSFGTLTLRKDVDDIVEKSREYFVAQVEGFSLRLQNEYIFMTFCTIILLGGLLYVFFTVSNKASAKLVKPINELSDGVREIASGNLDKKLDIRTGDEIEHLATCFNAMTDELKAYMSNLTKVTAEKERIATELDVAKDIQSGMLPKDFPTRKDFELLATMKPAKEVGGDFYDFYFIDETHLAITVADVSGKGIPAALFMVISKTVLKNFMVSTHNREGLAEVVAAANDKLCANNEAMMFVTAFVGVLDLETGEFTFVNAGHNPPVVYHAATNHCDFLDVKKNFVLGPMDDIPFAEQKISLKPGDLLYLYTDGVTEALNVNDEEYLPERLINFMNSTDCTTDLKGLLKNIRGNLSMHVGMAEQSDDITMFALRFNGGDKT
ncbi:MAG: SpoIIE family protein phosphatase [Selenomonadaceae bacterium]|nr:SpoIIE family protein phosphatase [Selenomonadaceae bacterium]